MNFCSRFYKDYKDILVHFMILFTDGKPSGQIMILGFYDHDKDLDDEESKTEEPPLPRLRHHTQIYLNGSKCDLTGNLRHTEVRVSFLKPFCA